MSLKRLAVHNLRNLTSIDIEPSDRVNLIYGRNGSGKTSLLEAISILGLGRSFRSHKLKSLISRSADRMTVFGRLGLDHREVPVGVQRDLRGQSLIKVDGKSITSAAKLAENLPVQVLNAQSFLLLDGSPKVRRQFMDWLVFHVKPDFLPAWKAAQRCLKHRNSLLRRGRIRDSELSPWDRELVDLSNKIDQFRCDSFDAFLPVFEELISDFVGVEGISLSYYRGWDRERNLSEILGAGLESDLRKGYTRSGPHRADLRITADGVSAADTLSRGQQKLLVCALRIAQGLVFTKLSGRQCVFLIDDLPAELDCYYQRLLATWLDRMGCQVFITGVEYHVLASVWPTGSGPEQKVFHVEQGKIIAT